MEGSGSGCLGRGGLTRGIQDPILSGTSLIRPTPPHAFHQGKSLGEGVLRPTPKTSHRTGSSDSRLLQSPIRSPEGLWVLATHHRPIYPEHFYRVTALPYGDPPVRPTLHSPGRLDDLTGPSGRIRSGSNPPGITSVSSLHHGRSSIPVQGIVFWANNCPSGLYKAHGSNIRHPPSLRYQNAPISRRLVDLSRVQGHLYSSEGQAPTSVRGVGTTSEPREVITGPISNHDLGMQILSVRFIAKPTETRVVNLLNIIEEFLSSPNPPAALWRRLLDHLSSLTLLVKGGMLRMRSLQLRLRSKWNFRDDYLRIQWDPLCQEDLRWWSWTIQQREGVDLSLPVPDLSFYSDASDVVWGAIMGEQQVSAVWTPSQKQLSINLKEMMAVQNGLLRFSQFLRGKTIALFCDNVTTVAYLRRSGGTRSQVLFLKAREILLWIESMKITILPQFIQELSTRERTSSVGRTW